MRRVLKGLVPAVGLAVVVAACGSSSSSSSASHSSASTPSTTSAAVVKTSPNSKLRATILVSSHGVTLYHLTGEQNGKFICTSAKCVQTWPPLRPSGSTVSATGVGSLSTVKRPDGTVQVTYKGWPLYTFINDHAAGQTNGEGIKLGGGTWLAATTTASASGAGAAKPSAPASSGSSTSSYSY